MSRAINLTGQIFGRLTVIKQAEIQSRHAHWVCQCSCGSTKIVNSRSLRSGLTKSCGCLQKEINSEVHSKHRMRKSRLYSIWANMIQRCENPNRNNLYQEKKIKVYQEWHNFENFMVWALQNGYKENLTIDRKNNEGDYEPSNCRWVDQIIQNNNRTNNKLIEHNGKKQTIAEWAKELNIDYHKLWLRLKRGWEFRRAVT